MNFLKKIILTIVALSIVASLSLTIIGCPPAPPNETVEVTKETTIPYILWDEAIYHIGERATVYGPVVSTHYANTSRGKPTFLNIGKPYPDPDRFTVIIWGENRSNFPQAPEILYANKTIYVTGLIDEYEGVAQIEVFSPSQIKE